MGSCLYTLAIILVIIWLVAFLGFAAGAFIHLLLIIAVVAILLRIIRGGRR